MRTDTAVILAGGKSSRMGFDKQLIDVNGTPLTLRIAKELEEFFSEIIIVTNKPYLYEKTPYIITTDIYPGHGPLSGIHAGMTISSSNYIYVTACDMPYISSDYIKYIKNKVNNSEYDGVIARYCGYIEPMNGIYSVKLVSHLEQMLKDNVFKLKSIIHENNFHILEESCVMKLIDNKNIFMNLNTIEELNNYIESKNKMT